MTPYEHKVRRQAQEAEAKRLKEEAENPDMVKKEPEEVEKEAPAKFMVMMLNEGSGPTVPSGFNVKVHYTGRLADGTIFDSSIPRGEPFQFAVGTGQVIRGWDEGVTKMKKGQKAIITCPPDYAYGARGAGALIPPNATLTFEVEVIDF